MKKTITLLLSLVLLVSAASCGNTSKREDNIDNQSSSEEKSMDEITDKLGGVISLDVPTLKAYLKSLYSDCYISGKIIRTDYDDKDDEYTYTIRDDSYYSTIEIHDCTQKFEEQDYIYATVGNRGKFDVVCRKNGLSSDKASNNYMTVKEYQNICDKINQTQFKVTGYVYAEKQGTYSYEYYDYYMYESEDAYGQEDTPRIELKFITEPKDICGKEIQIIGKHEAGGTGLIDCSVVDENE